MNAAVELYEFLGIEPPAPQTARRDPMTALPLRDFSDAEEARLAAIEAAPAAPESFDATAALRRVLALADLHEKCSQFIAVWDLRRAVAGD